MNMVPFASPGKGRTALDLDSVVALVDNGAADNDVKTLVHCKGGVKVELGTKFRTVLKKFNAGDETEEEE